MTWINIEPNYLLYESLKKQRKKDINLNIWIWNWKKINFYIIDNDVLSTFGKNTVKDYVKLWYKIIEKKIVQTQTLEQIFDKYANEKN